MIEKTRVKDKKAIFFDVNQTLVQQELDFEQCFRKVLADYTGRWLQEEATGAESLWDRYITRWQQRKKIRTSFKQLDDLQQQCLQEAFEELDLPVPEGLPGNLIKEVRRMQTAAKTVSPKTMNTLEHLSHSFKLAIISNSPKSEVLQLLHRFHLTSFFPEKHVFTAQKPSEKKPSPYLFKNALQTFQLFPRQAIMVGNSWKNDVCGAVKVGLDAIWLTRSGDAKLSEQSAVVEQRLGRRNVYIIKQLDQLIDVFK